MNQEFGRKYSMGVNALAVHETQPDTDPGTSAAASALKEATERFAIVAAQQRNGLVEKHSGAQEKERLRRAMISGPIAHMAQVGRVAAREHHELGSVFRFR